MQWCPRCGTSLSQHELAGGDYAGARAPVALRALPAARPARARRSWSGRRRRGRCPRTSPRPSSPTPSTALREDGEWVAVAPPVRTSAFERARCTARSSSGSRYDGPVRRPAGAGRRRAPRHPVGRGRARGGHGHRPHRAGRGAEDFELSQRARPAGARRRSTRPALLRRATAGSRGARPTRRRADRRATSRERGLLVAGGHDHPPLPDLLALRRRRSIFRLADEWFIAADEIRQPMLAANATVEWTPALLRQAHGRLAAQHGRLEHLAQALLRAAAAVLPVRRAAQLNVIGSRGGAARARDARARAARRSCTGRGSTR